MYPVLIGLEICKDITTYCHQDFFHKRQMYQAGAGSMLLVVIVKRLKPHPVLWTKYFPISKLTSAIGRLQIGNHVGPTSASDVGPTSSCSSVRRRADVYVGPTSGRRWPNVYCQHSPNVMPALNLMHRLADVQPMSSQCQVNIKNRRSKSLLQLYHCSLFSVTILSHPSILLWLLI